MLRRLNNAVREHRAKRLNAGGLRLWQHGDLHAAETSLREAARLRPAAAGTLSNLGMVLLAQGRFDEGMAILKQAVEAAPAHSGALNNLGVAYARGNNPASAAKYLLRAVAADPDNAEAHANLLRPLMEICDWQRVDALCAQLVALAAHAPLAEWAPRLHPYTALLVDLPATLQRDAARWYAAQLPRRKAPVRRGTADSRRIRIGYVSADLQNHATAQLCAGMFERHDRTRFEVTAYSSGADDGSAYRKRIREGCDRFVDIGSEPYADTARRIETDGIQILVDMKGYCGDSRPEIFALRPAPLQVSFLGYPGSLHADFMDYIVADRSVIPAETVADYAEAPLWMPGSYQVNDAAQPVDARVPSRAECGLPADAFVYCCFNQSYKIDRATFELWLRVLRAVPASVLWLYRSNVQAKYALWKHADRAGVARERIVFAPHHEKPQHLARLRLADLFLDTFVVNAHTTASDALYAGVPVLSCPGRTFASRVATSLLHAAGLPELVMPDRSAYERRAVELAQNPAAMRAIRHKLDDERCTAPLFDTAAYVRALDTAYERIWLQYLKEEPPAPIAP